MKRIAIFSFLLVSCLHAAWPQVLKNKFRVISTAEGLSSPTVNVSFKDKQGFLWIGTTDGLNKYDGYHIRVYKNDREDSTSISDNYITAINQTNDEKLLIGTNSSGISVYDPVYDRFAQLKNLPPSAIKDIKIVNDDEILIATLGGGLVHYNLTNQTRVIYNHDEENPHSISSNQVLSIAKNDNYSFWISTNSGSLDYFDLKTRHFAHYTYDPTYDIGFTNRRPILASRRGLIWIGTEGQGLYRYDPVEGSIKNYTMSNSPITSNLISGFYEDSDGYIYIGTDGYGINILEPYSETFSKIESSLINEASLSSDAIYDIRGDQTGNIYISTFRGGVNIYSPKSTRFDLFEEIYKEENSLSFNSVIALHGDNDGMIWIGTDGGGLDLFNPLTRKFKHFTHDPSNPNSISSNVIISVFKDSKGKVWAGTYFAGLNRLDPSTNKVRRYYHDTKNPNSLGSRNVWDILEDDEQNIWLGLLDGGMDRYNASTDDFTHYRHDPNNDESISSDQVILIKEDPYGNIWIGTSDGGLNLFDRKTERFRHFKNEVNNPNTIRNNEIRALSFRGNQKLWIGTANGISVLDLKSLTVADHPINDALPNLRISGIRFDAQGNVWISHNQGLSRFNLSEKTIDNFNVEDGIQGIDFNNNADAASTLTGELFFGGVNGFNAFIPSEIQKSNFQPNIVITDIKLFGNSIQQDAQINKTANYLESIKLRHDQNVLTFEFVSLDFSSTASISYQYMLEGFDQKWTTIRSDKPAATYTNLDPGSYTLKIKGTNGDGIWSDHVKQIQVIVNPPWWATWWFRLLSAFVIISSVAIFIRWRMKSIEHQRKLLQTRVREATDQISSQNKHLVEEQKNLQAAIEETNAVITEAVESGNFQARIDTSQKTGAWLQLGESINELFNSITAPFSGLNAVIDAMSKNDLTQRYELESKGEIYELTNNLNQALHSVNSILNEIRSQANVIELGASEMQSSAEEMNLNTAEISSSISQMAAGASAQVEKIDQSSKILEGILNVSGKIAQQAQAINQVAKSGVDQSSEGSKIIQNMNNLMNDIKKVSIATNESIDILIKRSEEIGQVISMIKEISGETNMLSLNATIEASKAGDSGRGFAVIANQIRRLSEDATTSSKQIEQMIEEVQSATQRTEKEIRELSENIKKGESAANQALNSFETLASKYEESYELSKEILRASNDQNQDVHKVVGHMEGVVVIAEQTAAGTEEIAASAHELSTGMSEFARNSYEVSAIIADLTEKIERFKLDQSE